MEGGADLPCHHEVFEAPLEGVLVSPCTAGTLSAALIELCRDPERRQALGLAARHKVLARFNVTRMVSDYERLYAGFGRTEAIADSALEGMSGLV